MRYWGIIVLLLLVSCKKRNFWDETTGTYTIPSLNLSYVVPTNVEYWAIADIDGSIPELQFCGVDATTCVNIVIVKPNIKANSITKLDKPHVEELLYDIICQNPDCKIFGFNPQIEPALYLGTQSWKFMSDVSIEDDKDSVAISYAGYFFNSNNRVVGIMSIIPTSIRDSLGRNIIDNYFMGLNPL